MWIRRNTLLFLTIAILSTNYAAADGSGSYDLWEALTDGKATVNMRARVEIADADAEGAEQSEAYTLRTRLGYRTKPIGWFSIFGEFENVSTADDDAYRDPTEGPGSGTIIADPPITQVNQAYFKLSPKDGTFSLVAGRQRVILDDARFVGNVGWRQNEQTFDAVTFDTSFGDDRVSLVYGYVWDVNRIFGDQGPAGTRDFETNTHLVNLSFKAGKTKLTGFAYLLDVDDVPGASSSTYGLRIAGKYPFNDGMSFGYQGSYASQSDAADNPTDYQANYLLADGNLGLKSFGTLGVGYELLGSDEGNARFLTPLATAHKFNGWADVFLNNGGPNGLQDLYGYYVPKLPKGWKARVVFHSFQSDEGGNTLGNEIDAVISKAVNKNWSVLAKMALFSADEEASLVDVSRFWVETTFKF